MLRESAITARPPSARQDGSLGTKMATNKKKSWGGYAYSVELYVIAIT